MEYELHADGTLTPLPTQNVDTGLGLERGARDPPGRASVYDTDGYQLIMDWIAAESGVAYGDSPHATKAHRVLADHGRGMTFLVADGVTPSNEGRGYVLRRIIRRAVQQAQRIGLEPRAPAAGRRRRADGRRVPRAAASTRRRSSGVVRAEEERFRETLERGLKLVRGARRRRTRSAARTRSRSQRPYGFPIELTRELAEERGLDRSTWTATAPLMEEHREISRAGDGSARRPSRRRRSRIRRPEFVGYEKTDVLTQIDALEELGDGRFLAKLRASRRSTRRAAARSPTPASSSTRRRARAPSSPRRPLRGRPGADCSRATGFAAGDRVRAVVPWGARFPTMANHTATHLLHQALREVLGDHVKQAGSAVRPDKLRFDFTHSAALTAEERVEVERLVNEKVFETSRCRRS